MQLYKLDRREIRSFRLWYHTLELKSFFENKQSFGLFMMADTLQPSDRINNRENFIKYRVRITKISKKIGNFLTKNIKWFPIKNLFLGNVILACDIDNLPIKPNSIQFLLKNIEFSIRFLYWNENIYRENSILNYLNANDDSGVISLSYLVKKITKRPLISINPFVMHYGHSATSQTLDPAYIGRCQYKPRTRQIIN